MFGPLCCKKVLIGKKADVYQELTIDQSSDYDKGKTAIFKAQGLVSKAYTQKFRKYKKIDKHVEFGREKENLFDQW